MTKEEQQQLHKFETRVRQLVLKHKSLQEESLELYAMVDERENKIKELEQQIVDLENKYNTLKTVKMLEISSDETESAQKRISKLIRDIDKCISLLNM